MHYNFLLFTCQFNMSFFIKQDAKKKKESLLTIVSDSILATFLKKQNSMHKDTVVWVHENESSGGDTLEVHFFSLQSFIIKRL